MSPEDEGNDIKKLKREQNEIVSQECRNSHATFASFGAQTPKSIPIVNLYAESLQDPGDEQELSQHDESERVAINAKTARETVQEPLQSKGKLKS